MSRRWPALLLSAVFAIASTQPAAAQGSTPATLSGESLSGVPQGTFSCDVSATSTISYAVSGTAMGPYPGTFTEAGTVSLGPQPSPGTSVPILTFQASFTITSGRDRITGMKSLFTSPQNLAPNKAFCVPGFIRSFGSAAAYDAQIVTADGVFSDHGVAGAALNEGSLYPVPNFVEFFVSSLPAPTPVPVTFAGLCDLTRQFVSRPGVAHSLCVKLDAAQDAAARGNARAEAGALGAYIHEVSAQSGKSIAPADAALLISLARTLLP